MTTNTVKQPKQKIRDLRNWFSMSELYFPIELTHWDPERLARYTPDAIGISGIFPGTKRERSNFSGSFKVLANGNAIVHLNDKTGDQEVTVLEVWRMIRNHLNGLGYSLMEYLQKQAKQPNHKMFHKRRSI